MRPWAFDKFAEGSLRGNSMKYQEIQKDESPENETRWMETIIDEEVERDGGNDNCRVESKAFGSLKVPVCDPIPCHQM